MESVIMARKIVMWVIIDCHLAPSEYDCSAYNPPYGNHAVQNTVDVNIFVCVSFRALAIFLMFSLVLKFTFFGSPT